MQHLVQHLHLQCACFTQSPPRPYTGSRLPLPADWMLQELPLPPAEAHLAASPGSAGEGALLLALGWEQQQLGSMGAAAPGDTTAMAEHKLRSTVLLLFGEQHEQRAQQGVVPGALETIGEEEEEEDDRALWERARARWLAAALMERYCAAAAAPAAAASAAPAAVDGSAASTAAAISGDDAGSGLRGWQQQEARQLAQHFAAASYGDALFGAAVALLLRRTVRLDVQASSGAGGWHWVCCTECIVCCVMRPFSCHPLPPRFSTVSPPLLPAAGSSVRAGR